MTGCGQFQIEQNRIAVILYNSISGARNKEKYPQMYKYLQHFPPLTDILPFDEGNNSRLELYNIFLPNFN